MFVHVVREHLHRLRRSPLRTPAGAGDGCWIVPGRFEAPPTGGPTVIELTKGQELALTTDDGQPLARLQLGVGWDKEPTAGFIGTGAPEIDLDASAVQFASGQLF